MGSKSQMFRADRLDEWFGLLEHILGPALARSNGVQEMLRVQALSPRLTDGPGTIRHRKIVAVVGGGSVAVSFLNQFVRSLADTPTDPAPAVLLFEPQAKVGGGQAYEDDYPSNLLNTRADTMSPVFGDPHHFICWLKRNEHRWRADFPDVRVAEDEFLPRPLFGRYLEAVYEETVAQGLARDISITHIRDCVTDILPVGRRLCLDTSSGEGYEADVVVLATGNLPSVAFPELLDSAGFFNSPYPGRRLAAAIPVDAPVAVLGTNLSAIDTVVALAHAGHRGKVVCISRNGRLPSVRGVNNRRHRLQFLTRQALAELRSRVEKVRIEDVAELLVKEFQAVEGGPVDMSAILDAESGPHDYLIREIDESSAAGRTWQSVVYATNAIIEHVWHALDPAERRRFYQQFRSLWFSYRVSFPLRNAQRIRELMRRDQMAVAGGFQGVEYDRQAGRFRVSLRDPRSGLESTLMTSYLVNATSYSTDVTTCKMPLVCNLLRRGLATPDEFGGFQLEFETGQVKDRAGQPSRPIYAIGALATGTYFWTNAMDVNARIAATVANVVVQRIVSVANQRLEAEPLSPGAPQVIGPAPATAEGTLI